MESFAIPRIYTSSANQEKEGNLSKASDFKKNLQTRFNFGFKKEFNKGRLKIGRYIVAILIILIIFIFGRRPALWLLNKVALKGNSAVIGEQTAFSQKIQINKKYIFSGLDDNGKKKDKLELTITEAEKTDQVIVQEKTYTAKNEKTFLIINLELKNDSNFRLNIFPGDLIRLSVNGEEQKLFAPDLHNNYVLVAPISTKIDRVGFVIDKSAKDLKLQVGEIEGEKEIILLNF